MPALDPRLITDNLSDTEFEALWVKEAKRRLHEMEQGEYRVEEMLRHARAAIPPANLRS